MENILTKGAIPPEEVAAAIAGYHTKTDTGAHSLFLGQVRADEVEGKKIAAIEYTAYEDMAEKAFHTIREAAMKSFSLTGLHIRHSLGTVRAGELCLLVFAAAAHRKAAMAACHHVVEAIKNQVPVFGKELFEDGKHQWKVNR